jgi:endonuclease III related protein
LSMDQRFIKVFKALYQLYGAQGWWPLLPRGYHPKDFSYPRTPDEVFEISVGAILTQNTSWTQVEKALENLSRGKLLTVAALNHCELKVLSQMIRPAGYFNQKARYLKNLARNFQNFLTSPPSRKELLEISGVGEETADSILLYAFKQEQFVIDAYTRRLFSSLEFFEASVKYEEIKNLFESNLPRELELYQEYHALIVRHAKTYYSKKPWGQEDPLKRSV